MFHQPKQVTKPNINSAKLSNSPIDGIGQSHRRSEGLGAIFQKLKVSLPCLSDLIMHLSHWNYTRPRDQHFLSVIRVEAHNSQRTIFLKYFSFAYLEFQGKICKQDHLGSWLGADTNMMMLLASGVMRLKRIPFLGTQSERKSTNAAH